MAHRKMAMGKSSLSKLRWRTPLQATGYVRASAVVYCIFN